MSKEKKAPARPAKKATTAPLFDFSNTLSEQQSTWFKYVFFGLALLIFLVRPMVSNQFGPSSDETYHRAIGDLSYDYLSTFGKNDSIFRYAGNGREDAALLLNYGPLLEVSAAAIYKNFGTDVFHTRHAVITVFTFLLFFFCGLAAYEVGGWRAALIAMLFMLVSPRLLGEAFNNPKDPPFAAGYMMAVYGLLRYVKQLPRPDWKSAVIVLVGIGLAFSIRVGAIILYPFLFLFVGLAVLMNDEWRTRFLAFDFKYYQKLLLQLAAIVAGSWLIGIIAWPAALRAPISHPFYALKIQSTYPTVIRVLFDGAYIPSNEVPWNYNPTYIALTSPLIVILGLVIGIALLPWLRKTFNGYALFMLLFVSVFPLAYIIYKHSALLNGWRHSYFTYTGIAVFAALTFEGLLRLAKTRAIQGVVYGALAIGILLPATFIVKNFPVVYTYFNELAGGVSGTYGDYQLDYYACSAAPAAEWLAKNVPYDPKLKIVSNNPWELNVVWESAHSKFTSSYIRFRERNEQDWDYAVFLPQFVDPYMMKKGFFPPKGTVHTVTVDGCVVACVVKRESKDDFAGIEALKKNDLNTALPLLEKAVQENNTNEIAWAYLGVAYAYAGKRAEALNALSNSMNISPEYQLPQMYYQQISQSR
ncbi:MAG: phospholipid carrier-dependent glycosyltransferase [Chitinophagales bacterium]